MPSRFARAVAVAALSLSLVVGAAIPSSSTPPESGQSKPQPTTIAPLRAVPPLTALNGADISWPNCPRGDGIPQRRTKGFPMPKPGTRFALIGLTNGIGFTRNPCIVDQVAWADRGGVMTAGYSRISYPTKAQLRDYGTTGPYGAKDLLDRLRNAGWNQGMFDLKTVSESGLRAKFLWVDVEPMEVAGMRWSTKPERNNAVIDGVIRAWRDAGYGVGLYSFPWGWQTITGNRQMSLPVWQPRPGSRNKALEMCNRRSFSGGPVVIAQWFEGNRDLNVTCPAVSGAPASIHPLTKHLKTTLKVGSTGPAVTSLGKALGLTVTVQKFGPLTRSAVVKFQKRTGLPTTGVVDARTWRALGAGRRIPAKPSRLALYFSSSFGCSGRGVSCI